MLQLLEGYANSYDAARSAPVATSADFAATTLSKYSPDDQFTHAPMSPTRPFCNYLANLYCKLQTALKTLEGFMKILGPSTH